MLENKDLFDFMLRRVKEVGAGNGLKAPQAFGRWFAEMYFHNPRDIFISDGSGDAKVDLFFTAANGKGVDHCVLNTKFTEKYNAIAPVSFYNEIISFWQAFANKGNRGSYLSSVVRPELRPHYKKLFQYYDADHARLFFVTNSRRNEAQIQSIRSSGVEVFHLEDVLQFMVDYIEDAMPHTPTLLLTGISTVLSAGERDSEVPTSIVFARLSDFITYMEDDPYDLLFARNVRLSLGETPVNLEIRDTYRRTPKEFAFSNNGITVLCEKLLHDPGAHEVRITNPRIVNGSQTLHSIRHVEDPSPAARVMVRIIEISRSDPKDLPREAEKRKDIIHKISIRSNRQNDIKKWDLVSNDDFQHQLARYFRTQKLFYERRRREWRVRRTELKSLRIKQGPDIKGLTQLIASYYWDRKLLGPVAARRELALLFDGMQYEQIKSTRPEVAYQLFLLDKIVEDCVFELSNSKRYVASLAGHMKFVLFSVTVKALNGTGAKWGASELTKRFQDERDLPSKKWRDLVIQAINHIRSMYRIEARRYRRAHRQTLPYANYFKSQTYVGKILTRPLPRKISRAARATA